MSHFGTGLLLCEDLLMGSKVTGTAQALGLTVRQVRDPAALLRLATETSPACILLDLHHPGLDAPNLLAELAQSGSPAPRVVGFGSHVDAALLNAARQAGCDPVWPRSKFFEQLPEMLPRWLGGSESSPPSA
ncbi:MAG: response regulator [Gemmataceae bacterium]